MEKSTYDNNLSVCGVELNDDDIELSKVLSSIAPFTFIVLELLSKSLDKEVIRLIIDLQIAYTLLASENEVLKQENAMLKK